MWTVHIPSTYPHCYNPERARCARTAFRRAKNATFWINQRCFPRGKMCGLLRYGVRHAPFSCAPCAVFCISIANKAGDWNYSLIEKVADAVFPFRPDWVIQATRKQAEGLIAKTQSKYYATAARWLAKMKQAYLASGRKAEWLSYLEGLKSTYSRRPALQAELKKL